VSDAGEMRDLLTYASYAKVGAALGVSRNSVSRWARGLDVTPYRLDQVRQLLRPPQPQDETEPQWARALLHQMTQISEQQQETPRPVWAEGLEDRIVDALEARFTGGGSLPDRVAERVAVRLGLPQSPISEDALEETEVPPGNGDTKRQQTR
jgi:hypothetical protein